MPKLIVAEKWKTDDEKKYLRGLRDSGNIDALRVALYWVRRRRWDGPGMAVDVDEVERCIRQHIRELLDGEVTHAA